MWLFIADLCRQRLVWLLQVIRQRTWNSNRRHYGFRARIWGPRVERVSGDLSGVQVHNLRSWPFCHKICFLQNKIRRTFQRHGPWIRQCPPRHSIRPLPIRTTVIEPVDDADNGLFLSFTELLQNKNKYFLYNCGHHLRHQHHADDRQLIQNRIAD